MEKSTEIPIPSDSGSDGSQISNESLPEPIEARQLEGLPIAQAITGLASSNNRAFGGEVASALIAGATTQLASELQYTKKEVVELRKENGNLKDNLSNANIQKAILEERINSYRTNRHLRNFGIAVGTTLLGASSLLFTNNLSSYAYTALGIGALLLILGWYSSPEGGNK